MVVKLKKNHLYTPVFFIQILNITRKTKQHLLWLQVFLPQLTDL
jgi:hypothetical protein